LFNDDNFLTSFDRLGFHNLLLTGLQSAIALGLGSHALNCVHHILLLRKKGVPKVRRPRNVPGHALQGVGHSGHRLHTWVIGELGDGVRQLLVLEILVIIHPLLELDDFQRIGRSGKCLGK
jgi:hypothetical protein